MLPAIEIKKPASIMGKETISSMQAGIVYGYIGQVEYLIRKFRKELGAPDALVVATGGMARIVAEEGIIDKIDSTLTLKGLKLIYERNQ